MARTIWKYDLTFDGMQEIHTPKGSKILHVGLQQNQPKMWVLVDAADQPVESEIWEIRMFGTGHPVISKVEDYIGTLHLERDTLILHVFARLM